MRFPYTGSSFERVFRCVRSTTLPEVRRTNQAAIAGTQNHLPMWTWLKTGDGSALKPLQSIVAQGWSIEHVEPAYALNLATRTSRHLGDNIGRDYAGAAARAGRPLLDTEVCLSTDVVGERREDGTLWIIDWKSSERVMPAGDNLQVRAAVAAVVCCEDQLFPPDAVVGALGYLDTSDFDAHVFDRVQIDKVWDDLDFMVNAWRMYQGEENKNRAPSTFHVGPWCKYCPGFLACEAQTGIVRALVPELQKMPGQAANYSPQEVGMLWDRVTTLADLAERAKESLKVMAEQYGGRVPFPDGKRMLKVWRHSNKGVDWAVVMREYKKLFGEPPKKTSKEFLDARVVSATASERMELGTWETGGELPEGQPE